MKYNTNLASEFYVLTSLARLGVDASLTLGNKKKVDIAIMKKDGTYLTIDVKGVAGTDAWLLGKSKIDFSNNHYFILISYEDKIGDMGFTPLCWIFPAIELKNQKLIKLTKKKDQYVGYKSVKDKCNAFKNKWNIFI